MLSQVVLAIVAQVREVFLQADPSKQARQHSFSTCYILWSTVVNSSPVRLESLMS
jgi:hypothetical protein